MQGSVHGAWQTGKNTIRKCTCTSLLISLAIVPVVKTLTYYYASQTPVLFNKDAGGILQLVWFNMINFQFRYSIKTIDVKMIIMKIYFYPSRNQKKKTRKKQQPNKRNIRESNFDFGMYIFFLIFEVVLYYIREVWICVFFSVQFTRSLSL